MQSGFFKSNCTFKRRNSIIVFAFLWIKRNIYIIYIYNCRALLTTELEKYPHSPLWFNWNPLEVNKYFVIIFLNKNWLYFEILAIIYVYMFNLVRIRPILKIIPKRSKFTYSRSKDELIKTLFDFIRFNPNISRVKS